MEMMIQPNAWSCMPTALAMVLNLRPTDVIKVIGHDGSKICSNEQEPLCRRGFDYNEIFDVCYKIGVPVGLVATKPVSVHEQMIYEEQRAYARIGSLLQKHRGIILGLVDGKSHAVAWDTHMVHDPTGYKYEIDDSRLEIEYFILVY